VHNKRGGYLLICGTQKIHVVIIVWMADMWALSGGCLLHLYIAVASKISA